MSLKKEIIEPSWEAKYSFSPAVIIGCKTIWLAGYVGFVDDSGASLAGTRQAFKNLERTLQRAGGTLKDIVSMTVSVSDGRYSQRFTDIRKEIYRKDFPASTLLTAAALAAPNIMVEITGVDVFAALRHCECGRRPRRCALPRVHRLPSIRSVFLSTLSTRPKPPNDLIPAPEVGPFRYALPKGRAGNLQASSF